MDDVTIHIDELVVDGSAPLHQNAIAIAIAERTHLSLDPGVVADLTRAVTRALSSIAPASGRKPS